LKAFPFTRFPTLVALALAAFAGFVTNTHASRSGLNNVPNADTSASGTGVVQAYSVFGEDRKPSFLTGVRLGFAPGGEKIEMGFDTRWKPGTSVPVFFNAKWASHWDKTLPKFAVGVASLAPRAQERDRLGQPQTYGVFTYDAGFARLHAGYAVQRRNNAMFFGIDRTWLVAGHKLMFRSDVIEIQGAGQWLGSAGFTFMFTDSLGMELWQSKLTEQGMAYTTFKLGYSFKR
jgi:hypothetical protein